jgi:UDP-N-acetylglucosamine 1-carboxyvinyltransferase
MLSAMGVEVERLGKGRFSFRAVRLDESYLQSDEFLKLCSSLRGSVMLMGPLLARLGRVLISKPGGDKIGRRRLDTHFQGLMKLGASFAYNEERDVYELAADTLKGTYMLLDEASVTGTANIIMAAVLAEGTTTIYNAACEPYIQQLCRMLNRMGARIDGLASNRLVIQGVGSLHGCEHTILPDMIEVGSFIGMAAMTRSELTIRDVSIENLGIIPDSFRNVIIIRIAGLNRYIIPIRIRLGNLYRLLCSLQDLNPIRHIDSALADNPEIQIEGITSTVINTQRIRSSGNRHVFLIARIREIIR